MIVLLIFPLMKYVSAADIAVDEVLVAFTKWLFPSDIVLMK